MTEEAKRDLIRQLKKEVHSNPDLTAMDDGQMRALIQRTLDAKLAWARDNSPEAYRELSSLNFRERHQIAGAVYESIRGLGVLGQIIADPDITEVMINGYQDIFVERAGRLTKLENHFESRQELETIITKFVSQSGRVVNESEPIVDTHLEDGSRVNVVMPPVALNGPIVTIRRFPKEAMTVEKLIGYGSITPEVARVLEMLVRARYNIFVSGGTGSGKTTFLNALSNFIPRDERIITIEDSAELQIKHIDNLVRLETRNAGPDHHHPGPDQVVPAYAPGPHRGGRGPRGRGVRHAPGHEHRPRRLPVHRPRQLHPGYAQPTGDHGAPGGGGPALRGHPPADRLGGGRGGPPVPSAG